MKTLTINLPESVESEDFEIKMILAGELYERGKVSIGQAAEIAGVSKRVFMECIGRFGFSVFGDSVEDVKRDILNA